MTSQADDATTLRQAMVTALRDDALITTDAVAAAMDTVPRHDFAPGEPLEKVYQTDTTLVPKIDAEGRQTSVVSAAHIQAIQLEQADLRPGMNVLEIGSGGYNAALIAQITGPAGSVTSVDIDADVIDRARAGLARAGYEHVNVALADAENGVAEHAPYDRIIVTVGARTSRPPGSTSSRRTAGSSCRCASPPSPGSSRSTRPPLIRRSRRATTGSGRSCQCRATAPPPRS